MTELVIVLVLTLLIFVIVGFWSILIRNQKRKKEIRQLEKYLTDLGKYKYNRHDKAN